MSFSGNVIGFVSSAALIPIMGQLSPDTTLGQLATGTAQFILSVVVVVEACAIYKMFQLWRKDIETDRLEAGKDKDQMEKLIADNSASSVLLANSNKELKEAVYHFSDVVKNCDSRKHKED